jgi:hypothetical protein
MAADRGRWWFALAVLVGVVIPLLLVGWMLFQIMF